MRRAAILVLGATLFAGRAEATPLSPAKADKDAKAFVHDGDMSFCTAPSRPLSARVMYLCPLAKETPGCEALASACRDLEMTPPKPPPRWLVDLVRALGPLAQVAIWLGVLVVLALIVVPLVRAYVKRRRDRQIADVEEEKKPDVETRGPVEEALAISDAELLLRRAQEAEGRGELAAAIDAYLASALVALDHRGAIRLARHRTNGEYVRSCTEQAAREPLREVVRAFDDVRFGGAAPTREIVSKVSSRATTLVRGAAMLALVFLLAVGCSGNPLSGRGDPGGDDVFVHLLKRQGVRVGRPSTRLAGLPMPHAGTPSPVVVVDFTQTPLDDETRDHVVRWVKKGGALVMLGKPESWPKALTAQYQPTLSRDVVATSWETGRATELRARVSFPNAFRWEGGRRIAETGDSETFASEHELGEGVVIGVASHDLATNVGLVHEGNAAALFAILESLDRAEFLLARPEDGTAAATNPFAALARAGLGPALGHALVAVALLFLAVGSRLARATPTLPAKRRAFVEHVEATGAFWSRAKVAPHALATYARWADERLRAKMPRGATDVPTYLAMRTNENTEDVAKLWARAQEARSDETPKGDELGTLKRLSDLVTRAQV